MAEQTAIDELVQKMREERSRLLDVAERFDERAAEAVPVNAQGEEQWSAKEQFSHLTEMEVAYRAWVARALFEDNPNVVDTPFEPVVIPVEEAHRHSVAEHIAELRRQREKTHALIEVMKPADFDRTATHPAFGTLTVLQWLRSYYRHDRMHTDQLSGREPAYKPQFAGGREPDQRTPRLRRPA